MRSEGRNSPVSRRWLGGQSFGAQFGHRPDRGDAKNSGPLLRGQGEGGEKREGAEAVHSVIIYTWQQSSMAKEDGERVTQLMNQGIDRRRFFQAAGAAGLALAPAPQASASPLTEKQKLARLASNTWPLRFLFKSRMSFGANPTAEAMKKKYGEITMLDFPQFTKDTFPGVTHMDLFSGLFGDVTDDSMYVKVPLMVGAATRTTTEFDPSSAAGKQWLEKLANKMAATGTQCQHISNNAPRDICDPDVEKRKAGRGSRQEMAGRREDDWREIDAGQQRRSQASRRGRWSRPTIRRTTNSPNTSAFASTRSRRWRTMARRSGSR